MKILFYSHSFGNPTTTFIYNEIRYLSQKGHEVFYLCNEYHSNEIEDHCTVIHIPFKDNKIWKKIKWILWKKDLYLTEKNNLFRKDLLSLFKKIDPDIIHCHFAYESLRLIHNLPKDNILPFVIHVHGYGGSQMLKKKSYISEMDKILKYPNCWTIIVSDSIKRRFERFGFELTRSIRINCGINLDLFSLDNNVVKNEYFTFLQVSSLVEKKGHVYSIQAFANFLSRVNNPKRYKYIFTGYNSNFKHIKKLVSDLSIEKNVEILGYVTPDQVKKMIQKADVFLHHSITPENGDEEGIPTSIMEAMAMKLPILSTFHAGIPELVQDGVNGLLCLEKDVESLTNQMIKITKWDKKDENRNKINNHFNYYIHNELLLDFYKKIIISNSF